MFLFTDSNGYIISVCGINRKWCEYSANNEYSTSWAPAKSPSTHNHRPQRERNKPKALGRFLFLLMFESNFKSIIVATVAAANLGPACEHFAQPLTPLLWILNDNFKLRCCFPYLPSRIGWHTKWKWKVSGR